VIAQIAQDKKLLIVVRKAAVAWNGPTLDITKEALDKMNA
jgi:Skp family chaperone for outer membrane proteins